MKYSLYNIIIPVYIDGFLFCNVALVFNNSLRKHPNFEAIKMERKQHTNCEALADLLASLSVGHQP